VEEVQRDPRVIEVYLGHGREDEVKAPTAPAPHFTAHANGQAPVGPGALPQPQPSL